MDKSELRTYIAKTFEGLEELLLKELSGLGASDAEIINRGVRFRGDLPALYRCIYNCRLALRILYPIAEFQVENGEELYRKSLDIRWEDHFSLHRTFAIDSVISYTQFKNSQIVSLKVKDAIADRFRDKYGSRPTVDKDYPDLRINVHLFRNQCTVSLDFSGSSMHLRGYRKDTVAAPINEVLAAGLCALAGWKGERPLLDPMCGSGTILIEAAMIALDIPAGFYRKHYAFHYWKDYDKSLWEQIKQESNNHRKKSAIMITGRDKSEKAIRISRQNVQSAGLERYINLEMNSFEESQPPFEQGMIITNPPYGERLTAENTSELYKKMGDTLKQNYAGYSAWILSGDLEAIKHFGLKPSRKIKIFNGPLECKFVNFELYSGSLKKTGSEITQ